MYSARRVDLDSVSDGTYERPSVALDAGASRAQRVGSVSRPAALDSYVASFALEFREAPPGAARPAAPDSAEAAPAARPLLVVNGKSRENQCGICGHLWTPAKSRPFA